MPVAALLGVLRIEQLYLVAFLAGTLTVCFHEAYLAYLPTLVRREELLRANSTLALTASVAEFGAFGLGGWLVQLLTAPVAILVAAATFLASALLLGLIRTPEPPRPASERPDAWRETVAGVLAVLGSPLLRPLARLFVPLAQGATPLPLALRVAAQLAGDGAATTYEIHQVSLRQATTPRRLLGRVNASIHFAGKGAQLGGLLAEWIGLRETLLVGAGVTLLAACCLLGVDMRRLRAAPPAEDEAAEAV